MVASIVDVDTIFGRHMLGLRPRLFRGQGPRPGLSQHACERHFFLECIEVLRWPEQIWAPCHRLVASGSFNLRPIAVPPAVTFELVRRQRYVTDIAGHLFYEHEPHTRLSSCDQLRLRTQGVVSLLDTVVQRLFILQVIKHVALIALALAPLFVLLNQRRQELLAAVRASGVLLVHGAPLLLHVRGKLAERNAVALHAATLINRQDHPCD